MNHQADPRSLNFAGDVDDHGWPLPMTVEVLQSRTEKWTVSEQTPEGVAALLARSRRMFVDGYYTYENFMDAATRSLQAVEAALRVRFGADEKVSFFNLIKRAHDEDLVDDAAYDVLNLGRRLRNSQVHATNQSVVNPVVAANIIRVSHLFVSKIFDPQP